MTDVTDASTIALATAAQVGDLVKTELGYKAQEKYTASAITTLANPATEYPKYQAEVKALFDAEAVNYKADLTKVLGLGIPEEQAKAIALRNSKARVDAEMGLLDLKWPLMRNTDLMATAAVKGGVPIHVQNPFGQSTNDAKIEKYRAAYKAQKAKNAGKSKK